VAPFVGALSRGLGPDDLDKQDVWRVDAIRRRSSVNASSDVEDFKVIDSQQATDCTLPTKADVVIIGAGIVGTAAAYYLAKRGQSVVLCEKGRVAGEQSSRNWGFVRQQGRDPAEIPAIIESQAQDVIARVESIVQDKLCSSEEQAANDSTSRAAHLKT